MRPGCLNKLRSRFGDFRTSATADKRRRLHYPRPKLKARAPTHWRERRIRSEVHTLRPDPHPRSLRSRAFDDTSPGEGLRSLLFTFWGIGERAKIQSPNKCHFSILQKIADEV